MVEAIESGDDAHICEELGDVLFQVVLHAHLAKDRGAFAIEDVIESITGKIVRRHPHVFAGVSVTGIEEVFKNWEEIKAAEKALKPAQVKSVIDVPISLPALQRAEKIGDKTKKMNFDWTETRQVLAQLRAEVDELEEAMQASESSLKAAHIRHEIGDVLFSAAQLARHLDVEPESSLRDANRRFIARFEKMLALGQVDVSAFTSLAPEKKEKLWTEAKKALAEN